MTIIDLYSKRQKRLRGDVPDVYVYDQLPEALRNQIVYIWQESLGNPHSNRFYDGQAPGMYKLIVDVLCREYGVLNLPGTVRYRTRDDIDELTTFFTQEKNVEHAMDVVELTFKIINGATRSYEYLFRRNASAIADAAIEELNGRFKEHGIGYQFVNNEIVRVDSEFVHAEVVITALRLLNRDGYKNVQDEFLKAHEHYRHGNSKEALNECLKAFESTMKVICDKRGWSYGSGDTAKGLIQLCLDNELVPSFWQSNFVSLRSLLEGGIPTGRNKLSGHGQGSSAIAVPDHLVAYMLHMTASTIVFLCEAEAALA